ncbi:hypothetical protein J3E72DRAFT_274335 [Bipolaris maydis]|uniref:uncharacterized protein n=1 Tax=Cochliobolus heterostrophus TaxID=5016 RepID=UPI0024DB3807|nr:hypothetical protein J3E73DRAFT_305119 [Bipolaris maydis]KAJ6202286.1 hypothetical protein J3E72DRAFT_274335 [Bipolaris maydis]KAJ6208664.1 hypothetical protein PSV09DRAFT_2311669 [Bipolaris maydis]KAJ6270576.1 hypothetical protein PSV08DRAFT_296965 [Bipolaris maydis]KAJ6277925.1 hypothetical protein J3E71DRAFT_319904 [Bipolaris maydis]
MFISRLLTTIDVTLARARARVCTSRYHLRCSGHMSPITCSPMAITLGCYHYYYPTTTKPLPPDARQAVPPSLTPPQTLPICQGCGSAHIQAQPMLRQ